MSYEVIVVGGGIGGLTTASLLAKRGMKVCLFERAFEVGGCAAAFHKLGFTFEQGASLYYSWSKGEIHDLVFSELKVSPPECREVSPSYIVRLPDGSEVAIAASDEAYEAELRAVFPECADAAVRFFRELTPIANALHQRSGVYQLSNSPSDAKSELKNGQVTMAARLLEMQADSVEEHLAGCSNRFHRFLDAQLQMLAATDASNCSYLYAAMTLRLQRQTSYEIKGGASSVAKLLADSFTASGGTLRLSTTVLRLLYSQDGKASGVELLNGEKIEASRAVVSNLTVWDTYGKLVGVNRTPSSIRVELKKLGGWGAFLLYLSIEEQNASALKDRRVLAMTEWQDNQTYDPEQSQFMFSCAPQWDPRGPVGKRALTVWTFADVEPWFSFHEDEREFDEMDQCKLEAWWQRLHAAMPELGGSVEVIETATPRNFYEATRRRFGIIGSPSQNAQSLLAFPRGHKTAIPNLYMAGDTTFYGQGLAGVTLSALVVADELARPTRS